MEDNFRENNEKLIKTHETQGILEKSQGFLKKLKEFLKKTQGILEKTQGTGGLSLTHPPKKCPKKKPALREDPPNDPNVTVFYLCFVHLR